MANILIVGCGYVGREAAASFADRGDTVWGMTRSKGVLPAGVQGIVADVTDAASLSALPTRLDTVIYAVSARAQTEAAYQDAYTHGVETLLSAIPRSARFIFVSSTGVFAEAEGAWVDETSATTHASFSARALLAGEALTLKRGGIVLRLAGIYGPGRVSRLIDAVREGTARCATGGPWYSNFIHRDDAAGILVHLCDTTDAAGIYLGVDNEPVERNTVLRWVAHQLGLPDPPTTDSPPTQRGGNKRCSNARIRRLGYTLRYPTYEEGLAEFLV